SCDVAVSMAMRRCQPLVSAVPSAAPAATPIPTTVPLTTRPSAPVNRRPADCPACSAGPYTLNSDAICALAPRNEGTRETYAVARSTATPHLLYLYPRAAMPQLKRNCAEA